MTDDRKVSPRPLRERLACINCGKPFTFGAIGYWYGANEVGPFCKACDHAIKVHTRFIDAEEALVSDGSCHHCNEQGPSKACWWCGKPGTGREALAGIAAPPVARDLTAILERDDVFEAFSGHCCSSHMDENAVRQCQYCQQLRAILAVAICDWAARGAIPDEETIHEENLARGGTVEMREGQDLPHRNTGDA